MQKAPVMKGSGLIPLEENKPNEEVHVFGRNLEERVVTQDEEESTPSISFDNNKNNQNIDEDDIESIRKRKFDAITGEEDEETIFQSDFKLFIWDLSTSNWIEKGRGQLKLNDSIDQNEKKSRLIMRVSGTLRIILNIAINRSYFRILASSKTNIRFTDSQSVWAASGNNAHQLRDLIDERLKILAEEDNELRKKSKTNVDEDSSPKKTKSEESESEEDKKEDQEKEAEVKKEDEPSKNNSSVEISSKNEEAEGTPDDEEDEHVEEKKITKSVKECEIREDDEDESTLTKEEEKTSQEERKTSQEETKTSGDEAKTDVKEAEASQEKGEVGER